MIERTLKCDEVDLIFEGYWDDDHFSCTGVRLAAPYVVMEDIDYLSDIDDKIRQERAESEARRRLIRLQWERDTFSEVCRNINFLPREKL